MLRLPTATRVLPPRPTAIDIVVTLTSLRVGDAEVADMREVDTTRMVPIPALDRALQQIERRPETAPRVALRVDERVTFEALGCVLYTAARAGFYDFDFIVSEPRGVAARLALSFEPTGPVRAPMERLFLRLRTSGYDLRFVTYEGPFPDGPLGPIVPVPLPPGDATEGLRSALRSAHERTANNDLILVPDRAVSYGTIIATMDLLISERFEGISLSDGAPF